jgi:predicted AAA+ superfamily ATPase
MINRPFWIQQIMNAWSSRSIVWLSGVRRVGKTTLAQMLNKATYLNCDLPSVVRSVEDPELFFDSQAPQSVVIFDEVHRTPNPSRLLKIAADSYPHIKILATGSSTLAATQKFRDSLTGRKKSVYLPPVLWHECMYEFDVNNFDHRLLHGGLPEALLSKEKDPSFFAEWMDSFYARDIQELFSIRNRSGFMNLLRLLLRQSGGLVDYTSLAKLSDLSRPTVKSHIGAMNISQAIFILPPLHGGGRREITQRPKIYGFDTGFITFIKGWDRIREEDRGLLWEHLVLDTLRTLYDTSELFYWRDKSGREIDFIINKNNISADTIECKINPDQFNPKSLVIFRSQYPEGNNYLISPRIKIPYTRKHDSLSVQCHSLSSFPPFNEL